MAKKKSKLREYTEAIIIALILALLIRGFIVQAFKIPSGSMIPTLAIGDQILANKFIYGLKVPFTDSRFLILRQPRRGDIIVFSYPGNR
ncbi:MAG: signal peptidase I, partial [Candidatus Mariimomonas ferrooxydans]